MNHLTHNTIPVCLLHRYYHNAAKMKRWDREHILCTLPREFNFTTSFRFPRNSYSGASFKSPNRLRDLSTLNSILMSAVFEMV